MLNLFTMTFTRGMEVSAFMRSRAESSLRVRTCKPRYCGDQLAHGQRLGQMLLIPLRERSQARFFAGKIRLTQGLELPSHRLQPPQSTNQVESVLTRHSYVSNDYVRPPGCESGSSFVEK